MRVKCVFVVVFMIFAFGVFAINVENKNNDKFSATEIPDKWKNESAVIICQEYKFSFLRNKRKNSITESFRRRVKLLDKAAIDLFSEIYYVKSESDSSLVINIIKPDGTKISVPIASAIEVTQEIPLIYRSGSFKTYTYKKIAVPNIEVGDIIDYSMSATGTNTFGFVHSLKSSYPIVYQSFEFVLDKGFQLNIKSMNGAPEIKFKSFAKDYFGRERNIVKRYIIEDANQEKLPNAKWINIYNNIPYIKFNVSSSRVRVKTDLKFDDGDEYIFNTVASEEAIRKAVVNHIRAQSIVESELHDASFASLMYIYKRMTKLGKSDFEALESTYKMFRFYIYSHLYPRDKEFDESLYFDQYFFCSWYVGFFRSNKIDFDIVVAADRSLGDLSNIASVKELFVGFKVVLDGEDCFIFPFNATSSFGDIPFEIEGVEALVIDNILDKNTSFEKIILSKSTPEMNEHFTSSKINVLDGLNEVSIERTMEISGFMKSDFDFLYINYVKLFNKDCKELLPKSEIQIAGNQSFQDTKLYLTRSKDKAEDYHKKMLITIKEFYEYNYEFEIESYEWDDLNSENDDVRKRLVVNESFTTKDFINRAGQNYFINIGLCLGNQVKIDDADSVRVFDIYFDYPKVYSNQIKFKIPTGYIIPNLEPLIINVDNESGAFVGSAAIVDDELIVNTVKTYKKRFGFASEWENYIEFTEAAYNYSQVKVLMMKEQ